MEKKIILSENDLHQGNLILVNLDFPLQNCGKRVLAAADERFPGILMEREAANVLRYVLEEIGGGEEIVPVSGYRSREEQTAIFEDSLRDNGEMFTRKFVALPDHSEHQTGLAIDLALKKEKIDFICPDFPQDGICGTFRKAAVKYGFIERYPKEKEQVTGIAHEPWHFRYVGYPHSEIMKKHGFVLEEYIGFLRRFPMDGEHLHMKSGKRHIEVFYVPADSEGTAAVLIPEQSCYDLSGNNIDGFIVTLWRNEDEQG